MERIFSWVNAGDVRLFSYINLKLRCRFLNYLMPVFTHLGGATFTLSLLISLIFFFTGATQKWAIEALISLAFSHLMVQIIKKSISRPRPYLTLPNAQTVANPLRDYSFPSGHTTASFSIATVFALHSVLLGLMLIPIACLVGLSRMYLGLHYPTDCFIGALLGTISSILIVILFM